LPFSSEAVTELSLDVALPSLVDLATSLCISKPSVFHISNEPRRSELLGGKISS